MMGFPTPRGDPGDPGDPGREFGTERKQSLRPKVLPEKPGFELDQFIFGYFSFHLEGRELYISREM